MVNGTIYEGVVAVDSETHRPRLSVWEIKILRNLVDEVVRQDRRNIGNQRRRMAQGQPDTWTYPLKEQEKALKRFKRLSRKLNKLVPEER